MELFAKIGYATDKSVIHLKLTEQAKKHIEH